MTFAKALLSRLGFKPSGIRRQLHAIYRTQAVIEFDPDGHVLPQTGSFSS